MRKTTTAMLALIASASSAIAHPNPQPPPRGADDSVFPSSNALLEGEERQLVGTQSLTLFVRCTVQPENPVVNGAASAIFEIRLVGPDEKGARARLVDGVGYTRETNDPVPGEVQWFALASAEAPTLSGIDTVQAIPDFDFRVRNERIFGTAIIARLDGDAERPCGFSLAVRFGPVN